MPWKTTYPDSEIVTATYDHSGQPKTLAGTASYITNATYDVFGRLTALTHGNGTTDTRNYYGLPGTGPSFPYGHRLSGVRTQGTGGTYLDLSYASYTPRGLLSQITDNVNADRNVLSNKATFGYDDLARLTSATVYYDSNSPLILNYGYNALGNLTAKEGSSYTYSATKPHQASLIGGTTISYDLNGSVSSGRNAQQYLFDKDDRLKQATVSGTIVTFAYDYAGQQVAKTVGTSGTRYYSALAEVTDGWLTKYYFFGGRRIAAQRLAAPTYLASISLNPAVLFAQLSPAEPAVVVLLRKDVQLGISVCALLLGGGLLLAPWRRKRVVGIAVRHGHVVAVIIGFVVGSSPWPLVLRPHAALAQTGGTITHFHADHLGSTEVITTSTGALLQQVRYKPFGEIRYRSGTSTNHYEFTGYETDTTSALEYAGARFYDPALALFLTQDPAHQFASPYLYTNGNPTNLTDPSGAAVEFVIFAFILAFTATFVQASVNGAEPAEAAKAGAISGAVGLATGFGLGIVDGALGVWSTVAQHAFEAAVVGGGVFSAYEGFSSGQYVLGAVGVVATAYGAYKLWKGDARNAAGRVAAAKDGSGSASNYTEEQLKVWQEEGARRVAELKARVQQGGPPELKADPTAARDVPVRFRPGMKPFGRCYGSACEATAGPLRRLTLAIGSLVDHWNFDTVVYYSEKSFLKESEFPSLYKHEFEGTIIHELGAHAARGLLDVPGPSGAAAYESRMLGLTYGP